LSAIETFPVLDTDFIDPVCGPVRNVDLVEFAGREHDDSTDGLDDG